MTLPSTFATSAVAGIPSGFQFANSNQPFDEAPSSQSYTVTTGDIAVGSQLSAAANTI